ncbi:hypothetical protein [Streptomyces sp. NPDC018352]|uniref:effector-associated constant component EACC1 n=1 Tax=Streptomyces sp. NPDC018352 TaxID=3157194 RepID=UPI00340A1138
MRIDVRVGAEADELRSLHQWLGADREIRRSTSLTLQEQPPEPGHMGGLLDVLDSAALSARTTPENHPCSRL